MLLRACLDFPIGEKGLQNADERSFLDMPCLALETRTIFYIKNLRKVSFLPNPQLEEHETLLN
jgi:hypothetical protein